MILYKNNFAEHLRAVASNIIDGEPGSYTTDMFYEDFPQFKKVSEGEDGEEEAPQGFVPESMMNVFMRMCNDAVAKERWGEMWRLASGLYVAHFATTYLKSNRGNTGGSASAEEVADSGSLLGIVNSASLGDASVSYDTSPITAGTELWGQWNQTAYGQQFASMAKLVAIGGGYVM